MVSQPLSGVKVTQLKLLKDDRGWLAEILRQEQLEGATSFGQVLVTTAYPGAVKGNHYHRRKTEWFCVIKGRGLLRLEDNLSGACQELHLGDGNLVTVKIPPEVTHAIQNEGEEMLYLLIYANEPFDPQDPDTFARKIL